MKTLFPSSWLAALIGSMLMASSILAQTDAPFAKANQEYADGKFREAIDDYEALVHAGEWSAALFYNLGNAYFRTSDFGHALLNDERALALQPNHPEAQTNLRIAREQAHALELSPGWAERIGRGVPSNRGAAIAAVIFFWGGLFLFAASLLTSPRRKGLLAFGFCALLSAAFLSYFLMTLERGVKGGSLAIVTGNETQARLATADTAASVMVLPTGSEVKVDQQRGDWVYAELPNNQRGWIPSKSIELVRR